MKSTLKVHMRVIATTLCIVTLLFCLNLGAFADTGISDSRETAASGDISKTSVGTETGDLDAAVTAPSSDADEKDQGYILKCAEPGSLNLRCKSAILMEASTGTVLYTQNEDERLPPASVTKIMTLLLVMEAIDSGKISLTDKVSASANAASMGGSQIYLKEGEEMTVEDLLKSVVICSANDAAVALAEYVCGSEASFVTEMNKRAKELGMENTVFENTNGLDDTVTNHVTSAEDIAIMSRELIRHNKILEYSSRWMDTVRDGAFGLTNTNRLVRFYRGCTGLKTGSTSKAGFCVSVTAERDGMGLICVIMGAETRDIRNAEAAALLDWGFANYGVYKADSGTDESLKVLGGKSNICKTGHDGFSCVLPKSELANVSFTKEILPSLSAPVKTGETVGKITYKLGEKSIGSVDIKSMETIEKISFFEFLGRMLAIFSLK